MHFILWVAQKSSIDNDHFHFGRKEYIQPLLTPKRLNLLWIDRTGSEQ